MLNAHRYRVNKLHSIFTEQTWASLYQTDVRARSEQLPRLRLRLMKEHRDAEQAGGTTQYDPARPWNYTFQYLLKQQDWWYETFERWATLIAARVKIQGTVLDGDAPVGSSSTRPSDLQEVSEGPAQKKARKQKSRNGQPRNQQAPPSAHPMRHNGRYTTTRQGKEICLRYQSGSCSSSGCTRAHQCNICLATHSANKCPNGGASNDDRPRKGGKGGKK